MCRLVRAQSPLPSDPVDTDRIQGEGAVRLYVKAEEVLQILMVQGCVTLVPMEAEAVGDPEIARHPDGSRDSAEDGDQAQEGEQ
jgi:hypothetical protein